MLGAPRPDSGTWKREIPIPGETAVLQLLQRQPETVHKLENHPESTRLSR
jgi:hypothetical protein